MTDDPREFPIVGDHYDDDDESYLPLLDEGKWDPDMWEDEGE